MLAFVDESGDAGRRLDRGSSQYLTIAIVIFADEERASDCDRRIEALRAELRLPPRYEFHFSHNPKRIREAFLKAVSRSAFSYHVFALRKETVLRTGSGMHEGFYRLTARMAFDRAERDLREATVVIDGSGERRFRKEMASYLRGRIRSEGGERAIRKVKVQRSVGNNLLQLADYVAGVSSRAVAGTTDGAQLRDSFLADHEASCCVWPE